MGFSWSNAAAGAGSLLGGFGGAAGGVASIMGMFGAGDSAASAREVNEQQMQLAREQMSFQERMSSSAHTREVADLRNAGLNPILSATGGPGASSPAGAMATLNNPNKNLSADRALIANAMAHSGKAISEAHLNYEKIKTEQSVQALNRSQSGGKLSNPLIGSVPFSSISSAAGAAAKNVADWYKDQLKRKAKEPKPKYYFDFFA